jgi:hypothetical protein
VELLVACLTFFGITWGFHREDRRDRLRRATEAELAQEQRHRENRELIRELTTELRYNPPHVHSERAGSLTAEGIRYRPGN